MPPLKQLVHNGLVIKELVDEDHFFDPQDFKPYSGRLENGEGYPGQVVFLPKNEKDWNPHLTGEYYVIIDVLNHPELNDQAWAFMLVGPDNPNYDYSPGEEQLLLAKIDDPQISAANDGQPKKQLLYVGHAISSLEREGYLDYKRIYQRPAKEFLTCTTISHITRCSLINLRREAEDLLYMTLACPPGLALSSAIIKSKNGINYDTSSVLSYVSHWRARGDVSEACRKAAQESYGIENTKCPCTHAKPPRGTGALSLIRHHLKWGVPDPNDITPHWMALRTEYGKKFSEQDIANRADLGLIRWLYSTHK